MVAILYDTYATTWLPHLTAAAAEAYKQEDRPRAYVGTRARDFWVAENDSGLMGFIDWDNDFVNALHVATDQARRGTGTRLLDFAEGAMRKAGIAAARLETDTFNTRSRAFYAARGYEEVDFYPDNE